MLLSAMLLACQGADPAVDSVDSSPELDPDDPAVLSACDETDLNSPPFMGASFDPATGALLEPLPLPYIVATTAGWTRPDGEHPAAIQDYSNRIIEEELFTHAGLLGATFGLSEVCGSARTLTLWRDEEALTGFVFSPLHSEAMELGLGSVRAWETMHWTETASDQPPTWDDARTALAEVRAAQ